MRASPSSDRGGEKRISQNEFTEKAWQAVVAAPDIAKQNGQQIVVNIHSTLVLESSKSPTLHTRNMKFPSIS